MRWGPVLASLVLGACAAAGPRPPNVVLIFADDLGYGDLGCYAQTKIRTPNIDRLAARGMRFTSFYSGSPVCAPSRCALLTGLHTGHTYIRDNRLSARGRDDAEGQLPIPRETPTFSRMLQQAGYATACMGKWGLGGPGTTGHPNLHGFDLFFGYLCQGRAHNFFPEHLWRNEQKIVLEGNGFFSAHQKIDAPLESEAEYGRRYTRPVYSQDLMIGEAVEFIRANRGRPFFLWYASTLPHLALQVPPDRLDAYPREWDEAPYLGQRGYLPHPRPRAAYAAMISELDAHVGKITAALDELGLANRTLIIFSSDNGAIDGAGGTDAKFFGSLGGLRGMKGTVYEGGIRVPMIAVWPGKIAAGSTSDFVGANWDFMPTILELAGVPTPAGIDGISFAPTLRGRAGEQRAHEWLYWEHNQRQQAVRMGRWKALRTGPRRPVELYDLEADPAESRDVAGDHPERVARAVELFRTARTESEQFPLVNK